jgi:hypothetical protein
MTFIKAKRNNRATWTSPTVTGVSLDSNPEWSFEDRVSALGFWGTTVRYCKTGDDSVD